MRLLTSIKLSSYIIATCIPVLAFGLSFDENFDNYESFSTFHESTFNQSVNSSDAVIWESGVRVKIVPLDGSVEWIEEPINGSVKNPAIGGASQPDEGTCSDCALRFRYTGSTSLSEDAWAEQRFKLNPTYLGGKKGLKEIWLQYDQYIPNNFHYRDTNPESSNWFGGGEKVLSLFADDYSDTNPTFIIGRLMRRADKDDPTRADSAYPDFNFSFQDPYDETKRRRFGIRGNLDPEVRLIVPNVDKGYWQRRTLHIKMPTDAESNDGIIEFWINRRVGEPDSVVEKIFDFQNGNFYGGDQNYINKGYLLGWSNSGFNEDTVFLIDNVLITDNPDDIDKDAFTQSAVQNYPPNPPNAIQVD